tara:strand:- start:37 stop:1266 length:1230 start_codon:yes stop_codon:yes gene_type:complete
MTGKATNKRDLTDVIKKQKRDGKKAAGITRAQASGISGAETAITSGQKTSSGGAGGSPVTQDLHMNTFDIRDVDRLYFSTTAGSTDVLTENDTGIESKSYYNGTSYVSVGMSQRVPANNVFTFAIGATEKFNIGTTDSALNSNLGLGGYLAIGDNYMEYGDTTTALVGTPNANKRRVFSDSANNDELSVKKSDGTVVSLEGGGGSSWVGTATSSLDMNNFNIEDVNVLKINSGSAGSADSFTMFGTSSAGAINLIDDTDFFDFQVDGDSKFRMYDDRIEINEPLRTLTGNSPDIGTSTYPFGTVHAAAFNTLGSLTVGSTSLLLGTVTVVGPLKAFNSVMGIQCTNSNFTIGTSGTLQIPDKYNNSEPSTSDLDGWFGNGIGCIGIMRTATQSRLYARDSTVWKYEILS